MQLEKNRVITMFSRSCVQYLASSVNFEGSCMVPYAYAPSLAWTESQGKIASLDFLVPLLPIWYVGASLRDNIYIYICQWSLHVRVGAMFLADLGCFLEHMDVPSMWMLVYGLPRSTGQTSIYASDQQQKIKSSPSSLLIFSAGLKLNWGNWNY